MKKTILASLITLGALQTQAAMVCTVAKASDPTQPSNINQTEVSQVFADGTTGTQILETKGSFDYLVAFNPTNIAVAMYDQTNSKLIAAASITNDSKGVSLILPTMESINCYVVPAAAQ